MRYRKKPVIIDAIQYTENSRDRIVNWLGSNCYSTAIGEDGEEYELQNIRIRTLEGELMVSIDDWVIKGVKGEFYPCKPDIFEATYEKVD
jgi:hypothetical protein